MNQQIRDQLFNRINFEIRSASRPKRLRLQLETMRELVGRLNHPELACPVIHVAGTKGKGSTSLLIAQILRASGYRVGLYTSPHLEKLEERFWIDGSLIETDDLDRLLSQVIRVAEELDQQIADSQQEETKRRRDNSKTISPLPSPNDYSQLTPSTFFEITTAVAFLAFQEANVDIAILETGMGGRLDSTNVCQPLITVITNVDLDHTQFLGDTVDKIAAEKGGIIKPERPVVSGVQQPSARRVIEQLANENRAPLFQLGNDFGVQNGQSLPTSTATNGPFSIWIDPSVTASRERQQLDELYLSMLGQHQRVNAALAVTSLSLLAEMGWNIRASSIRQGLVEARSSVRIEFHPTIPDLVFDMAHNQPSLQALIETLDELRPGQPKMIAFAVSRDKNRKAMMELIAQNFDRVIVSKFLGNPRSTEPKTLFDEFQQLLASTGPCRLKSTALSECESPDQAIRLCLKTRRPNELICVAGSIFFAGEMKQALLESDSVPVVS